MPNRYATSLLLTLPLLFAACTGTPTLEEKPSSEFVGLNKVSSSGFNEAWARPGAALAAYKVIQISPLQSADAKIVQPQTTSRIRRDWELTPQRQQALAESWLKSMQTGAAGHNLGTGGDGDKVLRIDAALTRIAPSANLQEEQKSSGRSTVYTEDSGEASIEFRLYDLSSGELLVVIRDKRRVGNQMWGRANTVTASSDVRTLFNSWSNQLLSRVTGK